MASLLCTHCKRRIFLRLRQAPPCSGLCVPCAHRHAEQQGAEQAWRKFRDLLLDPAAVAPPPIGPLRPAADLRHLF